MSKQIDNGGSVTANLISERYVNGLGMLEEKVKSVEDYQYAIILRHSYCRG